MMAICLLRRIAKNTNTNTGTSTSTVTLALKRGRRRAFTSSSSSLSFLIKNQWKRRSNASAVSGFENNRVYGYGRQDSKMKYSSTTMSSSSATSTSSSSSSSSIDSTISIGDMSVPRGPPGSNRPDLIPSLPQHNHNHYISSPLSSTTSCHVSHLRWMLQKDLILQQDFLLLGTPHLARDRRHLLMIYAALIGREVEYLSITRDTSDADLKQRREVRTNGSTSKSVYVNQAPVRAALNGRLLILDGLEKAERNVLPTLNNLLENREMSLDDGNMLVSSHVYDRYHDDSGTANGGPGGIIGNDVGNEKGMGDSKIYRVHPDFRVAALASIGGGEGSHSHGGNNNNVSANVSAILDPPLRSRFQARLINNISPGDMLVSISAASNGIIETDALKEMINMVSTIPHGVSLQSVHDAVRYLEQGIRNGDGNGNDDGNGNGDGTISVSLSNALAAQGITGLEGGIRGSDSSDETDTANRNTIGIRAEDVHHPYKIQSKRMENNNNDDDDLALNNRMALPPDDDTFIETPTTRTIENLILSAFESGRIAVAMVGPKGSFKSAMAREVARRYGRRCELFSLYSDMSSRDLLLTRGTDDHGDTIWKETPLVRAIQEDSWVILDGIDKLQSDTLSSLAMLFEQGHVDLPDGQRLHIHTKKGGGFRCMALAHPPEDEKPWITPEIRSMFHWIEITPFSSTELIEVLSGLYPSMEESTLRKIVHLREELEDAIRGGAADSIESKESLALTLRKLRHICRRVERKRNGGRDLAELVHSAQMTNFMPERERRIVESCMEKCGIVSMPDDTKSFNRTLDDDLLQKFRRNPVNHLLVPNPQFEENPGHIRIMNDILNAHSVGEKALLIMGYQGVGKNRVVDYLLHKLQCEREYFQLHRDTSVQSLLSSPSIEEGRIVYNDSALVRAARSGRILVLDEADKAPVEVVALLKGLIEDGELALPDGRILRHASDSDSSNSSNPNEIVPIHKDFRIWALGNPAGFPFHGNDFAREMADVFSCHVVPQLDSESHARILKSYGPSVTEDSIDTLIDIWDELSHSHQKGIMSYPFSVRESVSVIKHLNEFPDDGLHAAIDNVIAFDHFDSTLLKQLDTIFRKHGITLSTSKSTIVAKAKGLEGGISTPRTRASNPKHGKVDPDNTPHIGGNQWAGGTGGSDTAGLGGRGGPYRLDAGHPVHQISDEMKAEVSEEAQRRARKMAEDGLKKKLKELNMGELDWERYNNLRERVDVQIQELQVHLKDVKRRKEERIWLKRQSTGELDDSRIVDAVAGEKDIFKRRGVGTEPRSISKTTDPLSIKLVVDVSASMYRFNGYDGRLERLLEASCMIMEALNDDDRFHLTIVGHNGTSAVIPLVDGNSSLDARTQLKVLEGMVAHTQYTYPGDKTLDAISSAIAEAKSGDLILVITDANLKRYRIEPGEVSDLLAKKSDVHSHLILVGSIGEEAHELAREIPNGRAEVCFDSSDLPLIIKKIVASNI